ncbi:hypothetical protein POTOM_031861 [Populus tomentosa]|uniref:Uncharacterized protein n=1 Tax=Populus tomentosa TaxID=118781 RepID=A0A8X7Z3C6_POPTO|nr:hypothetical protein POTOM_031861 [Populus tomentosa]
MAAESNTGFHLEGTLGSALNRHAISFQSDAINSGCTTDMIPMGMGSYFGINTSTTSSSLMLPGSSSLISNNTSPGGSGSDGIVQAQAGNSSASSSLLLDSVPGLKHDADLAAEWSVEEQYKLEEGLQKYADEPRILRYIKIAAMLHDKTVRDVALMCRWMTVGFSFPVRKRRKAEDYNMGKKINSRKDKLVESSSKMNMAAGLLQNVASYPLMMHHTNQSEPMPFEGISGTTRLLDQNAQAFSQISANLSTFKLQDNIDFFCYTRNNITAILNDMREMPGIMSRMPPLPVSIDEDLANSILPNTIQSMMFGSPSGIQLKQEPRFEVVLLNAMFNRVSVLSLTLLVKTLVKLKRYTLVKPFSASSMNLQVPSNKRSLLVDGDFAERQRRRELEDRLKDHGLEALYSLKAVHRWGMRFQDLM